MPRNDLIQMRRGTAAQWVAANPVLDSGEFGVELGTGKVKIGDANTAWLSLEYVTDVSDLPSQVLTLNSSDVFGRVQVLSEPIPSVMDQKWGAQGDGVTDDSTAIQNAVSDCSAIGATHAAKTPLRFPAGRTYLLNSKIVLKSYVDVLADGATFVRGPSFPTGGSVFRATPQFGDPAATDVRWHGGTYSSSGSETGSASFFQFQQATNLEFDGLVVTGGAHNSAFYIQDSQRVWIHHCKVFAATGTQPINIVSAQFGNTNPTKYVWINDNYIECNNICICHFSATTSSNRTDPVVDLHIVNNTVLNTGSGPTPISIEQGGVSNPAVSGFDISGNTVICAPAAAGGFGILSTCDGAIADPFNISDITIRGNRIFNAGANGTSQAGISCAASNAIIEGNWIQSAVNDITFSAHGSPGLQNIVARNNQGGLGSGNHINNAVALVLATCQFDSATDNGARTQETYGTAAPTTGTWRLGARCWNTNPPAAGTFMWVCTTAGTPGTWTGITIP